MNNNLARREESSLVSLTGSLQALTLKEKLQMIDDYRAENPTEPLTEDLLDLVDSFRSRKEKEEYEKRYRAFQLYYKAILDLNKAIAAYKEATAYTVGLELLTDTLEKAGIISDGLFSLLLAAAKEITAVSRKALKSRDDVIRDSLLEVVKEMKSPEERVRELLRTTFVSTRTRLARFEYSRARKTLETVLEEDEGATIMNGLETWRSAANMTQAMVFSVLQALAEGMRILNYRPRRFQAELKEIRKVIAEEPPMTWALPPLRQKGRGRSRKEKPIVPPLRKIPVDRRLYNSWMKAIEEIRNHKL